jgi:hypothetical protein
MGFDCTLHVIDEQSIVRFVDRFLGRSTEKAPFDKKFKQGQKLLEEVRQKIASSPEEGARHLLQLCLMWCSAETPHVPSRNFALSYWFDKTEVEPVPMSLLETSLEGRLSEIVAAFPVLKGKLHLGFDGNYSVGYFVAPSKISELQSFIAKCSEDLPIDQRKALEPLSHILRVAEKKKMAYWEATDLQVTLANDSWLKEPKVKTKLSVRNLMPLPIGSTSDLRAIDGETLVISRAHPDYTSIINCAAKPPTVRTIPDFFLSDAFIDKGKLVGVARYQHKNPYRVYELPLQGSETPLCTLTTPFDLSAIGRAGDETILVPGPPKEPARWMKGDQLEAIQELPLGTDYYLKGFELEPFGDGSFLLGWCKKGYRLTGRKIEPLLDHFEPEHSKASSGRISEKIGEVITLSNRRVAQIHVKGEVSFLAAGIPNIMQMAKGPEGTLLLLQGDNDEDDAFKVLWPNQEVTQIKPKDVGVRDLYGIVWSPTQKAVLVFSGASLLAIDWSTIALQKRVTLQSLEERQREAQRKDELRKKALWQKAVQSKAPIELPIPSDGFEKNGAKSTYLFKNDVVRHPRYGLGLVRDLGPIHKPLPVQFEDETRTLLLTQLD